MNKRFVALTTPRISGVLAGLALARSGLEWADPALALVVAILVGRAGYQILRRSIPTLVDERALDARAACVPALKMEQLFETAVGLAEQGRTMLGGIPRPLDLALFVKEYADEVQGAFPPAWVQRGIATARACTRNGSHLRSPVRELHQRFGKRPWARTASTTTRSRSST